MAEFDVGEVTLGDRFQFLGTAIVIAAEETETPRAGNLPIPLELLGQPSFSQRLGGGLLSANFYGLGKPETPRKTISRIVSWIPQR
jgi:hypothetical protein